MNTPQSDVTNALQAALYDRLHSAVISPRIAGGAVPVYDRVPNDAGDEYITLASFTAIRDNTKQSRGLEATATLTIYERYTGDDGGKKDSLDVATGIIQLVCDDTNQLDLAPDWNVILTTMELHDGFESPSETQFIYQRVVRFRFVIEQNPITP